MLIQKSFHQIVLGYCWLSIGDTCSVQKPFTTAHVWLCMNSCFCLVAFGGPSIVYVFVILGQTRKVDVSDKLRRTKLKNLKNLNPKKSKTLKSQLIFNSINHGLRTPREGKAFTARPKIHSHSKIFRYGRRNFCLPHRPNFSDIFDLCLHWVSVVRAINGSK